MHSTPNPEQLLFSKTEEMPEGHMWQWWLTVQHTILMTDTLWKQKLDTIGWKVKWVLRQYITYLRVQKLEQLLAGVRENLLEMGRHEINIDRGMDKERAFNLTCRQWCWKWEWHVWKARGSPVWLKQRRYGAHLLCSTRLLIEVLQGKVVLLGWKR